MAALLGNSVQECVPGLWILMCLAMSLKSNIEGKQERGQCKVYMFLIKQAVVTSSNKSLKGYKKCYDDDDEKSLFCPSVGGKVSINIVYQVHILRKWTCTDMFVSKHHLFPVPAGISYMELRDCVLLESR